MNVAQAWTQAAPPNKKRKNPRDGAMVDWTMASGQPAAPPQFGRSPNVPFNPTSQHTYHQAPQAPRFDQAPGAYSNTKKRWNNLYYCASCGYDVDHEGARCPNPKQGHNPHIKRDKAHLHPGASMIAQHKMLPDGSGQGKGWLMAQATSKGFFTMARQGQQPWAQVFQGQLQGDNGGTKPGGRRRRGRRNGGGGNPGNTQGNWGTQ